MWCEELTVAVAAYKYLCFYIINYIVMNGRCVGGKVRTGDFYCGCAEKNGKNVNSSRDAKRKVYLTLLWYNHWGWDLPNRNPFPWHLRNIDEVTEREEPRMLFNCVLFSLIKLVLHIDNSLDIKVELASIRPLSITTYPFAGGQRAEPMPADTGQEAGYTLDRVF